MIKQTPALPVYLVERHELSRTGYKLVLEKDGRLAVVGDAADLAAAIDEIISTNPSVVVVAVEDAERDARLCEQLKEINPDLKLFIVTDNVELSTLLKFMAASASGFCSRGVNIETLQMAILSLAAGGLWFCPSMANAIDKFLPGEVKPASPVDLKLTDREKEILKKVVRGFTNAQIADEFDLSIETIKTYIRRIMDKSSIRSRRELTRKYRKISSNQSIKQKTEKKSEFFDLLY